MPFRLFLTSFAGNASSDNLHPSISGGSWVAAGEYQHEQDAKAAAQSISITQHGGIPGPNTGMATIAVVVKV